MADPISGTDLGVNSILLALASNLVNFILIIGSLVLTVVIIWFLYRLLAYNIDVELWERKGERLEYFGDDKARRYTRKGISYIGFLKNKSENFKKRQFPNSNLVYKKKLFGSKVKYILDGDDVIPMKIGLGYGKELIPSGMPNYQKIEYLQRLEQIEQDYAKNDKALQRMSFIIGAGLITMMLFGFFVIWQSNVATAEATRSLAGAVNDAVLRLLEHGGATLPAAPG